MQRLKLWEPIPKNFVLERIVEPITWNCCREVLEIVSPQTDQAELNQGERNITIVCGTHGDPVIKNSKSEIVLSLWQEAEIKFFMLLLKAAYEIWELENVLFPKWDVHLSDWMDIRDNSQKDGERRKDMWHTVFDEDDISHIWDKAPSYIRLKKMPHWDPTYYDVCIDKDAQDIILYYSWKDDVHHGNNAPEEKNSFRIWFDEIGDYLKTLFVFAQAYGGRTHPGRYKEMLDYLFSEEMRDNLRMRDERMEKFRAM